MLLVVLVLLGPREGLDLGPGSMGPAIDHEGTDKYATSCSAPVPSAYTWSIRGSPLF